MDLEKTKWQALSSAAHRKFAGNLTYKVFIENLEWPERDAAVLANFNYQVCNGGFEQWVDNGYAVCVSTLLTALRNVGTPITLEVRHRVRRLEMAHLRHRELRNGNSTLEWINEDEDDPDCGYIEARKFDDWFYQSEIYDAFERDVVAYFERETEPVVIEPRTELQWTLLGQTRTLMAQSSVAKHHGEPQQYHVRQHFDGDKWYAITKGRSLHTGGTLAACLEACEEAEAKAKREVSVA